MGLWQAIKSLQSLHRSRFQTTLARNPLLRIEHGVRPDPGRELHNGAGEQPSPHAGPDDEPSALRILREAAQESGRAECAAPHERNLAGVGTPQLGRSPDVRTLCTS